MPKKKKKTEEQNVLDSGIDMSKVKMKELRVAVKELNDSDLLDAPIKLAKRTEKSLALSFCKAIEELNDDGVLDDVPEDVFEYYGKIVPGNEASDEAEEEEAEEEEEEEAEEEEEEEAEEEEEEEEEDGIEEEDQPKRKPKTKPKDKQDKPKTKPKTKPKDKKKSGPGVIGSILEVIETRGPVTKKQILATLIKKFPDRDAEKMEKTLNCQISGKKRPLRMEKEKNINFNIDDKGKYTIKAKSSKKKKKKK